MLLAQCGQGLLRQAVQAPLETREAGFSASLAYSSEVSPRKGYGVNEPNDMMRKGDTYHLIEDSVSVGGVNEGQSPRLSCLREQPEAIAYGGHSPALSPPRYSSGDECCWLASQSGHAGHGAMWIASDFSTKVNSWLERRR